MLMITANSTLFLTQGLMLASSGLDGRFHAPATMQEPGAASAPDLAETELAVGDSFVNVPVPESSRITLRDPSVQQSGAASAPDLADNVAVGTEMFVSVPNVPPAEASGIGLRASSGHRDARVLIFVESFFGFGHFNIVDLLAKRLLAQGVEVGVASSTFELCGTAFDLGGAQKFYLPPLGVNAEGIRCKPNQEPFRNNEDDYVDLIYGGTRQVLQEFDPQLVVYELYPFMMPWRDASARAVNDHYRDNGRPLPERISLCRDIIHASKPWRVLKRLDTYCSRLMIRGDSRFARLEESQEHWSRIALPIDYVGNFAAKEPEVAPSEVQDDIVIFGGGGYRAEKDTRFLEAVVGISRFTEAFQDKAFKIILGAGTPDQVVDQMLQAGEGRFELMRPVGSGVFKQMLAGAAAVVTRAGYNTCFELVRMKKPFVVVPRELKEQRLRAAMLERSGYGRVVREKDLSAQALALSLDTCIKPMNGSSIQFRFDGAERMAQALAALLEKSRETRVRAG